MIKRTLLTLFLIASLAPLRAQEFNFGIITDYEQSSELDSIIVMMVKQIDQTIGSGRTVNISSANISYNNSSFEEAALNYQDLAEKTDLIILIGGRSIKGVSDQGILPVPTFGLGVVDPNIQSIPYQEGTSGTPNFTYIWPSNSLEFDLIEFKKIVPYQHLAVLMNSGTALSLAEIQNNPGLKRLEEKLNATITLLELKQDIGSSLENLSSETDAVYISDLGVVSELEIRNLADQLIENGLPSFSGEKEHVYQGIMACMGGDNGFEQIVRKLGVMIDDAISGIPLENMEVKSMINKRLFINENTANAIEITLPFEGLFTAKLIRSDEGLPVYSLADILELSFENNLRITISRQDIELAEQEVRFAKSSVLPRLEATVSGRQINEESASAILAQPERLVNGQLQLDQVIYSQEAFAGIKIAKYYQKAQEHLTEAEILEVMLNTFNDYLNVLAAKSILSINQENLENLRINLNLARLQVESGDLSQTELYRWESEVALATQEVVEASTNLMELKANLNNRLAFVLEKEFDIEDISVDDQIFRQFRSGLLSQYIESAQDIAILTDFLVDEAVNHNPNKKYIVQQMNALERKRKQDKRLFYTPDISLQAGMNQVFLRDGLGSEPLAGQSFIDNTWNIGVGLRYPIFSQMLRRTNLKTSTIQLDQLNNSRIQLDQELELAVRTSVLNAVSASTNINFSKIASENAASNFELMQIRYGEGDIDITQLIDAQRNSIQAKLRYAVSVYDYIRSQLNIQFAIGFFPLLSPESQLQEFRERFLMYQNDNPNE